MLTIKLVRDRIPEIMRRNGVRPLLSVSEKKNILHWLTKKLVEEAEEARTAETRTDLIEELADILEVIEAIQRNLKVSKTEVNKVRLKKLRERGGFKKRILLNEDKPSPHLPIHSQ